MTARQRDCASDAGRPAGDGGRPEAGVRWRVGAGLLVVAGLAAGSALATPQSTDPGEQAVREGQVMLAPLVHASPEQAAACLRLNSGRVPWPRGVDPEFTEIRGQGGGRVQVDQWFGGMRNNWWSQRFELEAVDGGTRVVMQVPAGRSIGADYARSARDLVALCAG